MKRRIILPDWVKKQSEDIMHLKKRIEELESRPITPAASQSPLPKDGLRENNVPPAILGPHRKTLPGTHPRKSIHAPTMSYESKIIEIESKSKVLNSQGLIVPLDKL